MITSRLIWSVLALPLLAWSGAPEDAESRDGEKLSVNQQMLTVVVPASDTIWGIDDPQSNEDWNTVDDAVIAIVAAFESIKQGGSGETDDAWAAEADWRNYSDQIISAAESVRRAVKNRNLDEVFLAGDDLYTPCEACHVQYHPGVVGQ